MLSDNGGIVEVYKDKKDEVYYITNGKPNKVIVITKNEKDYHAQLKEEIDKEALIKIEEVNELSDILVEKLDGGRYREFVEEANLNRGSPYKEVLNDGGDNQLKIAEQFSFPAEYPQNAEYYSQLNKEKVEQIHQQTKELDNANIEPLQIGSTEVMQEDIATGKLEARHILPITSVTDAKLEHEIREDIAKRINVAPKSLFVDDDWIERQYDSILTKFKIRGEDLKRYTGLQKDIKRAFQKAIAYKERIPEVEEVLKYFQKSNRFLSLNHPLVVELQGYLDRMAEPDVPSPRLLIAIDGKEPLAFSIGQEIVINLSLILKLDTIDEVVSVLAHEQGHHEESFKRGRSIIIPYDPIREVSVDRMREHGADLVTPKKLAKVDLNTRALADALQKITGVGSIQGVSHGNVPRRIIGVSVIHETVDFYAGRNAMNQNIPIPVSWKPNQITPSIEERIVYGGSGRDFKKAVAEASWEIILESMKILAEEMLRFITHNNFRDLLRSYQVSRKMRFLIKHIHNRINL
ncbi:MAG TPA: hypothetical protein EYP60_05325, partial [bacterium (Candidatus Stahlbacteria)]|nr:hypothetical protein [Candidatus Stahlbacteria bacterium]